MRLLNFFNQKEKINLPEKITSSGTPEGSMPDTKKIIALFQISKERRDSQWQQSFFHHVKSARLELGIQKIITGPDGFSYFVLQTPQTNQPFESYCLQNIKYDILITQGLGVILHADDNNIDWVFSHGDIVNLYLNNEFISATVADGVQHIDMTKKVQVIRKGDEVMIGQPSERYLPEQTRAALKKFLQSKGISRPMTMLLSRKINGKMIQELAVNIHPEDFSSVEERDYLVQQVGWFLPRHYLIVCFSKSSDMVKHFADL